MSELATIARPYAKAAFDFAVEKNAVESWGNMLFFAAQVAQNEDVRSFLASNAGGQKTGSLFIQICDEQLDEYGQNLVKVMAENGRLALLPQVFEQFKAYQAELAKQVEAKVTSAYELSAEQQTKLVASLEKRLERKVTLSVTIDPSIIGGLIIVAGDLVLDSSVRGQLDRLADALQS